jgi:transcriptional regulator with XRE-family HTH domain
MTLRKGPEVKKTIQELREGRGESQTHLAQAVGVTPNDVAEWEAGTAEPRISRMRALTQHFGVRDDQINLRPGEPSSIIDRLVGWS